MPINMLQVSESLQGSLGPALQPVRREEDTENMFSQMMSLVMLLQSNKKNKAALRERPELNLLNRV